MSIECAISLSIKEKIFNLETTLQQCFGYSKDLLSEFHQLCLDLEKLKVQFTRYKEKCESKCCNSAEELKKMIEEKDNKMQIVESALEALMKTKNFDILNKTLKYICGETTILTPPTENIDTIQLKSDLSPYKSPEKIFMSSTPETKLFHEESLSEIEGTPSGCTSPIIHSRKVKNSKDIIDFKDKKKCPDHWPNSESKVKKLLKFTPKTQKVKGKQRQTRLNLIRTKRVDVIDLKSPPVLGVQNDDLEITCLLSNKKIESNLKVSIKKEAVEIEDTIQPSPTSGPPSFTTLYKSSMKNSPNKFQNKDLCIKQDKDTEVILQDKVNENREDSINILNQWPKQFLTSPKKLPLEPVTKPLQGEDMTYCDERDESISVLKNIILIRNNNVKIENNIRSPTTYPLGENKNIINMKKNNEKKDIIEVTYKHDINIARINENTKRTILEKVQPIYKEPVVRKKAEKLLLRGWSCDECKRFYDELYKDDPEILAKKMDECSRHRGRNNPVRPKTPPGFWNPRWDVPEDTEEFNKRNNVN